MRILAVDTSTKVSGAAVADEEGIIGESMLNTGKTHSRRILPLVNSLLQNMDLTLGEMDGFAVTIGPGSFTGLRIGISTVKAFAQVLGKPVAGIVTLDALAENLREAPGLICPILDARKNEVYTAIYRREGSVKRVSSYQAVSPHDLLHELQTKDEQVTFLGDGVGVYRLLIEQTMKDQAFFASPAKNYLRPGEISLLGLSAFTQGQTYSADEIKPLYLRLSEAEIKWSKAHRGCCGE